MWFKGELSLRQVLRIGHNRSASRLRGFAKCLPPGGLIKTQSSQFLFQLGDTMNKKLLTVAIAGAMATPMAAQAVKYKLSGQVNRAIVFQDDGTDSQIRNVDSISSGTRFRLRGSEDLGNGTQVGFYWEMQTSSNPSSATKPTAQWRHRRWLKRWRHHPPSQRLVQRALG